MRIPCALVLLSIASSVARAEAQGLGQAAERERKRREALVQQHGPSRLLTDRDANPAGEWIGWRDWRPPDGSFTIQLPSRPTQERDEVGLPGTTFSIPRTYYHARDENGWQYWVFVIDYPADYVRHHADLIRRDFPMASRLPYESNDFLVRAQSQLGGREIEVLWGTRSQVVGCLVGTRYYHLMAKPAPGEYFEHRALHPFILSFRP